MEFKVLLTSITDLTPTVRSFEFEVLTPGFSFLPGQWIDLYIEPDDQEPITGGFTLVSSPVHPERVQLAIKRLQGGRAAGYMHERAQAGGELLMVGPSGDFYFQEGMAGSIVLIAGGIGINPLMSMLRYVDDKRLSVRMALVHSAKAPSEMVYRDELQAIASRNPLLRCYYTVTQASPEPWDGRRGRIDGAQLREAMPSGPALYYVCGPPGMPREVASVLRNLDVDEASVRFEEW